MKKLSILALPLAFIFGILGTMFVTRVYMAPSVPTEYSDINSTVSKVPPAKAVLKIKCPDSVEVGDMIEVDATSSTAESFMWRLPDPKESYRIIDNGRRALISAKAPGEVRVVVACAVDGSVALGEFTITVKPSSGSKPVSPLKPLPKITADTFEGRLKQALDGLPEPGPARSKIRTAFEHVSDLIDIGTITDAEKIIELTQKKIKSNDEYAAWRPALAELEAEMQKRAEAGSLVTPEQHKKMWAEVIDLLK